MLPNPLDIIWRCANNPDSVLTGEDFGRLPSAYIEKLIKLGLLRQAATATHVTCDACVEQHLEEVFQLPYSNGRTRFFISYPSNWASSRMAASIWSYWASMVMSWLNCWAQMSNRA